MLSYNTSALIVSLQRELEQAEAWGDYYTADKICRRIDDLLYQDQERDDKTPWLG